jgi:hypothetical protein
MTSRLLKLRTIGIRDYSVLEGRQRIGRVRYADEAPNSTGNAAA